MAVTSFIFAFGGLSTSCSFRGSLNPSFPSFRIDRVEQHAHLSARLVDISLRLFCSHTPHGRIARLQVEDFDDLSGAQELALGELVAEKFGSDFFFLDRFPTGIRPFYTMPCPDDKR